MAPEVKAKRPRGRVAEERLSSADWINAATDLLIKENVRGVKVDVLSRKLNVTKGSFYWHFQSRRELLDQILTFWRSRATLDIINRLKRVMASPVETLTALLALPRLDRSRRGAAVETSIRDWGRRNSQVLSSLAEVDKIRLSFFEKIFIDLGFDEQEAMQRAYLAYCIMMGDSILKETAGGQIPNEVFVRTATELLGKR
jgi:AcrR family transcriptional regulator